MTELLAGVDFSAMTAGIASTGLVIIGIAVALKGVTLVKRLVGKA